MCNLGWISLPFLCYTHVMCCSTPCNSPFRTYSSFLLLMEVMRYENTFTFHFVLYISACLLVYLSIFYSIFSGVAYEVENVYIWTPHKVIFSTMLRAVVLCDCVSHSLPDFMRVLCWIIFNNQNILDDVAMDA